MRRARAGAGLEPAASPFSPLSPARRPWRRQQQARSGAATYSSSSSLSPPGHGEHRRAGTDSPPSEPSCPALRDPLLSATPLTAAGRAAAGSPLAPLTRPGWDGRRLPRAGRARPVAPCARGSLPSGSRSGLREGPLEAGGGAAAAAAGGRAAAGLPVRRLRAASFCPRRTVSRERAGLLRGISRLPYRLGNFLSPT